MENNKSYFGEIGAALKTLGTGLKVTMKTARLPCMLQSVIVAVLSSCVMKMRTINARRVPCARKLALMILSRL